MMPTTDAKAPKTDKRSEKFLENTASNDGTLSTLGSDDFYILDVANSALINMTITLCESTNESFKSMKSPLFVTNSVFARGKPSVCLTEATREGAVLGAVKLNHFGEDIIALGKEGGEIIETNQQGVRDEVLYEDLRKVSRWSHARFEFGCECTDGRRRTFVWVRTRFSFWGDQPDLELREKLSSSMEGDDGLGEVLAVYKGCQGLLTKMRGTFYIKRDCRNFEMRNGKKEREEIGHGWSDWELMVLLSACGLIEASRRRARARRSA
jgi:hypothetical protein